MSALTYDDLTNIIKDRAGFNVTTDSPVDAATLLRFVNEAIADVWEISGGRLKIVPSARAWNSTQLCGGAAVGLLTDIADVQHVYATAQAPVTATAVTGSATNTITSAALFVSPIAAEYEVSGTNITTGTRIAFITDSSNATIDQLSGASGGSSSKTFSPTKGTKELRKVELAEIEWHRRASGLPTYKLPQIYSLTRLLAKDQTAGANNISRLDWWPSLTGFYFPFEYVNEFVPMDAGASDVPDLNDIESRDAALIAAAKIAPLISRANFVPSILMDISARTQKAIERKLAALLDPKAHVV